LETKLKTHKAMNQFKKMPFDQQAEAMQIICNIQTMQDKIHGVHYSFEQFVGNTLAELRELQNLMIEEWNKTFKT
jgi:hypothetical protein